MSRVENKLKGATAKVVKIRRQLMQAEQRVLFLKQDLEQAIGELNVATEEARDTEHDW